MITKREIIKIICKQFLGTDILPPKGCNCIVCVALRRTAKEIRGKMKRKKDKIDRAMGKRVPRKKRKSKETLHREAMRYKRFCDFTEKR